MKRLTDKEEEIMTHLWDHGAMYVRELQELYEEPRPHFNTLSTFVRILEQKGFVGHERTGNSYRYHALVSREDYSRSTLKDVVSRYFDNSVRGMLSAIVEHESLSDAELKELIDVVRNASKTKES